MNNVHDMGGMQNFGAVDPDPNEPLFHHEWEKEVLALTLAMGATGTWNIDESRATRESLPPAQYLSMSYYQIWLSALEILLTKHSLISEAELEKRQVLEKPTQLQRVLNASAVEAVLSAGAPVEREAVNTPQFSVAQRVKVRNIHPQTHTRLPAYIKGCTGIVTRIHGCHVFPDSNAIGEGENPHWLYNVQYCANELWGKSHSQFAHVHVDCWEPYLESA